MKNNRPLQLALSSLCAVVLLGCSSSDSSDRQVDPADLRDPTEVFFESFDASPTLSILLNTWSESDNGPFLIDDDDEIQELRRVLAKVFADNPPYDTRDTVLACGDPTVVSFTSDRGHVSGFDLIASCVVEFRVAPEANTAHQEYRISMDEGDTTLADTIRSLTEGKTAITERDDPR